jgi:hypothetical protein
MIESHAALPFAYGTMLEISTACKDKQ